jgi:hypothetical protein
MSAKEQIDAFIAHLKSLTNTFTESRSSLRSLLVYLRNPANQNKPFSSAQDAIKKCANPNDARLGKYRLAIDSLVAVWGTMGDYQRTAVLVAPPSGRGGGNAMTLVNEVKSKLEACKKWACNDVGTFPQCVNRTSSESEQKRIKSAKPEKVGMPILTDGSWNSLALQQAYQAVVTKQAGECTNYAYYGGYILSQGKTSPKPRLELISWEGSGMAKHCFVIVGRTGGTTKGSLPPVAQWNDDCVIVDCWALTLGHQCVFTKNNYCFKGMMHPSKVIMDSTQVKTANVPMKPQGGLKATGAKRW